MLENPFPVMQGNLYYLYISGGVVNSCLTISSDDTTLVLAGPSRLAMYADTGSYLQFLIVDLKVSWKCNPSIFLARGEHLYITYTYYRAPYTLLQDYLTSIKRTILLMVYSMARYMYTDWGLVRLVMLGVPPILYISISIL